MFKKENAYVLVTGALGMIGNRVVETLLANGYKVIALDRVSREETRENRVDITLDLSQKEELTQIFEDYSIGAVIHLAALAHTANEKDLSWERYYSINVECASNIFEIATKRNIPIVFSSTADVYGITDGRAVTVDSKLNPISLYAKSKVIAEEKLREYCERFNTAAVIARFAPVYTETLKRDIQKRYYLKKPKIAYRIGKGMEYEVLRIDCLLSTLLGFVKGFETQLQSGLVIKNVKDNERLKTAEILKKEREEGRAKFVLYIPKWIAKFLYKTAKLFLGKRNSVYLLYKAVEPLRTED